MQLLSDSPLLLLLLPLVLRLLPLRADPREAWHSATDLGLALAAGALTAAAKAWWLAPFAMVDGTDTSDLPDICATIEALRKMDIASVHRQPVAALLPAWLTGPLGLFDGVAAGALASAAGLGAAIYLWARILGGRAAGVAAAAFSCAFNCYVVMPRYLTFFPECIVAYGLCAAGAAAAVRWRNGPALGLAGAGVGLALAVDHTGLLYALVPLGIALVVALRAPRRRVPLRLALVLVPVLLSWGGARLITPPEMATLEGKAVTFTSDNVGRLVTRPARGAGGKMGLLDRLRRWAYPGSEAGRGRKERQGYNWGRSGPVGMVRALVALALLTQEAPTPTAAAGRSAAGRADLHGARPSHAPMALAMMREKLVSPWIPVALVSLLLCGVALRRRRRELAGLLLTLVPFALLLGAMSSTQVFPKFLMGPMVPLPVLMGVAWSWLAHRPAGEDRAAGLLANYFKDRSPGHGQRSLGVVQKLTLRSAPPLLAAVITGLLVTGVVPSWLGPEASRRQRGPTDLSFYRLLTEREQSASNRNLASCHRLLAEGDRKGVPTESRLYPEDRFDQSWSSRRQAGLDDLSDTDRPEVKNPRVRPPPDGPDPNPPKDPPR